MLTKFWTNSSSVQIGNGPSRKWRLLAETLDRREVVDLEGFEEGSSAEEEELYPSAEDEYPMVEFPSPSEEEVALA